jgi:3-oxoacyl-[acyl-carrier-protein] synthase II
MHETDVLITGVGVASPIGIGRERFWSSLLQCQSGVARIGLFDPSSLPVQVAAEVRGFDPKPYVANRKSLKVMSRDAQLGMAASALACRDAGIAPGKVDPERFGIVLGADSICNPVDDSVATYSQCMTDGQFDFRRWATDGMAASFPLGFLRVLPNMIASHISIAQDARGPNNTIHQAEMSSALAVIEAATVIQRGAADVMMAGGASSQMNPVDCLRRSIMGLLSNRQDDPARILRPFDAGHDGQVWGEGATVLVLESRRRAESRAARPLARLLGWGIACEPTPRNLMVQGEAIVRAMRLGLARSGLDAAAIGHVNAHGLSSEREDHIEAKAICAVLPSVAVTAPKSYFGNLGSAGAATEIAASVLSLDAGLVPATLNYERPDPECPVRVVQSEAAAARARTALCLTWSPAGQAAAIAIGAGS